MLLASDPAGQAVLLQSPGGIHQILLHVLAAGPSQSVPRASAMCPKWEEADELLTRAGVVLPYERRERISRTRIGRQTDNVVTPVGR